MKKLIIAISSAFIILTTSAMSASLGDLRPSIGISGNIAGYAATGIEENYNEAGTAVDTRTTEHGAFGTEYGSIFLELGLSDVVSIGVDYVPTTIETPKNTANINEGNVNHVEAHFEDLTTLYAKFNVPLGGAYVKFGYSHVDVISVENMSSGNSYGNDTTSGMTAGLGYNHEVASGVSVRAEVTVSEFGDVNTTNGQTNKTEIKVEDMIGARGTISIVKSF